MKLLPLPWMVGPDIQIRYWLTALAERLAK
jgi:hypothetical protein